MLEEGIARALPRIHPINTSLKTKAEVQGAIGEAQRLQLPLHADLPKTWDSLGALHEILTRTAPQSRILDAGAEWYSCLLPWLSLYGYRNLIGNNLTFDKGGQRRQGPISYEYGDITQTTYKDGSFDAVTCLSVVEHDVDWSNYLREMRRIIKPGGLLVTSTDYFEPATDPKGQSAFGVLIHIFTKEEIVHMLQLAEDFGFELTGDVDLECGERAITWEEFDLSYTFLIFSMLRVP